MKKTIALAVIILTVIASPAFASFIGTEISLNHRYGRSSDIKSGQPYELWRVLSDMGYAALANDVRRDVLGQTTSWAYGAYKNAFWETCKYSNYLTVEVSAYSSASKFGWYENGFAGDVGNMSKSTWGTVFTGVDGAGSTVVFKNKNQLGFWINPNGVAGRYYFTDAVSNGGNLQAVTFALGGYQGYDQDDYLVCFEDLRYSSCDCDRDFQDMIVKVRTSRECPEPITMALFGSGLAGIAVSRRRNNYNINNKGGV